MKKIKDTEYLHVSARIRCMEKDLLTAEEIGRMAEARTDEEAVKLLTDKGWAEFDPRDMNELEESIAAERRKTVSFLSEHCPQPELLEVFRLKYDYHNIKTLLKADARGVDANRLLSAAALIDPRVLAQKIREDDLSDLDEGMAAAITEARDLLARTGDPQLCDILLDRAQMLQMQQAAAKTGSEFLMGYVQAQIDAGNLKAAVRMARMGKGLDVFERVICPGGKVPREAYFEAVTPERIEQMFREAGFGEAAVAAREALSGEGSFAALDMACDNALILYTRSARMVPFGEATLIAYLLAREAEFNSVRAVMVGRVSGLAPEKIMERLRISYV